MLLACALTAPAAGAQESPPPLQIVAFDYPPFYAQNEAGQAKGPLVDIVRETFRRMRRSVDIQIYPLQRCLLLMDQNSVDGMFSLKKTAAREQTMRLPREPLLVQDFVVFVRRGSATRFDGRLESLKDVSLGVVKRTSYGQRFDEAAKNGVFQRIEVSQDFETNFRKLLAGRMDALVSSRPMGMAMLNRLHAEGQAQVSGPPIETTVSYLAFSRRPGLEALPDEFDRALKEMKRDGSYQRLLEQNF